MKISKVKDGAVNVITLITTDSEAADVMARLGRVKGHKPAANEAKILARAMHGKGKSLRAIADVLAQAGFTGPAGRAYGPSSITCMLED